ncbi:50S ribosomal protein L17 [Candidatus Woesebacteria bacterium]|nr:50S ribosomal protein L17 [Candidatus Woesebacteria bacterium]
MKKKVFGRYFSRSRKAREALFKSLIKAFFLHGKMTTTLAKAKAIQGEIDKIVTLAKKEGLSKEREIAAKLSADRTQVGKITGEIATTFKERAGGFTRIIKLPVRKGDAAEMARIEWAQQIIVKEPPKTKSKKDVKASPKTKKVIVPAKKRLVKKTK